MDGYIYRLIRLGFSIPDAFKKFDEYVSSGNIDGLEAYITDLESDLYVD